ncbi:ABC-three component system protein [Pseudomonadota bacterium]
MMPEKIVDSADSPHTAITTWSGFIYQGKVAIYHVLNLLKEMENCNEFSLQLDSLEDFSILDGAEKIVSLHQVKANKSQYYSSYKEAINKLERKASVSGCGTAKFHLAMKITDKTNLEIASSHPPVEIYDYDQDSWCSVDEIDRKIEEKIQHLLTIRWAEDASKQSGDYARKVRGYIDQIILKKVLKIHRIVHENLMSDRDAAYTQKILFTEFIETLQKDLNQEDLGEDYYFYLLLNYFFGYYQDYCIEHEKLTGNELKKLSLCMKEIGALDNVGMIRFICNIMPHREFKFNVLSDFKDNTFDKDGIQEAFLNILNELRQPDLSMENFFRWRVEEKSFSPTVINKGESLAGKVCCEIIKNAMDRDLDVMFEGSNLITTDINVDSVTDKASELIRNTDSNGREGDRISRWKKVSLVSLSSAREIIND